MRQDVALQRTKLRSLERPDVLILAYPQDFDSLQLLNHICKHETRSADFIKKERYPG